MLSFRNIRLKITHLKIIYLTLFQNFRAGFYKRRWADFRDSENIKYNLNGYEKT